MNRRFVTVGGRRQVHYRRAGEGPAVVLLHESPLSSRVLVPLAEELARAGFTALALDTPGYGQSERLGLDAPAMADYADALEETLGALDLERCALYGAATGAQIALEYARRHPQRLSCVVAEGAPALTPEEREPILARYCPPLDPVWDGSHLLATWTMRRDQAIFWPWFARDRERRRRADMLPTRVLHEGVVDVLRAGPAYGLGYFAAFAYDPGKALSELRVPATVAATEGTFLVEHMRRLPESVRTELLPEDRQRAQQRLVELLSEHPGAPPPGPPAAEPIGGRITRDYADTEFGQLLVRRAADAPGRPLVMLHSSPGSGAGLEPLMRELAPARPLFALDTLGNGESDKPPWSEARIADYGPVVAAALAALGLDEVDLYGTHTGASIALETALAAPERVRSVVLSTPTLFSSEERERWVPHYAPELVLRDDGAHLLFAWTMMKDYFLFWPWFDKSSVQEMEPPPPSALHALVVELLKAGESYHIATRAAFSYAKRDRLPLLTTRALMMGIAGTSLSSFAEESARLAPNATATVVPAADTSAAIADFLDG